jgi:hypothetical protein
MSREADTDVLRCIILGDVLDYQHQHLHRNSNTAYNYEEMAMTTIIRIISVRMTMKRTTG